MAIIETDTMVKFWGPPCVFSNFTKCPNPFQYDGHTFNNSEAVYVYMKAKHFNCQYTINKILIHRDSPSTCKKLGSRVIGFIDYVWDDIKFDSMTTAVYLKFSKNPEFRKYLQDTGSKAIVECNPYDRVWGIGLSFNDPDSNDISKWKGTNHLGRVLMSLRHAFNNSYGIPST